MSHPSLAELLDDAAPAVRAHLGSCDACRALSGLAQEDPRAQAAVSRALYRELGLLAVGGMGRTTRALDLRLGRVVAVKEMKRPDPGLRARFEREALLTARLQHPAIVSVYEAGRWLDPGGARDGDPFYAMELVEGRTLDLEIAAAGTLQNRVALLPAVIRVVEAVAYAQEQGIVHRDIKPQNILIGRFGETVLIDWGLAKDLRAPPEPEPELAPAAAEDGSAALTEHGAGTAQYMSPQQARGEPVDPRFDVYALGATLYETLSGAPPYGKGSAAQVRARVLQGPPAPLSEVARGVPLPLQTLVARAMARDPAQRFPGARELADELRRFQAGQLVSSHEYSPAQHLRRFFARPVVQVGALGAVLLFAVAGALGVRLLHERDQATAALTRLYQDQGADELTRGSPLRALAFLSEARRRGADSASLRYLLHTALRPLDALQVTLAGHQDLIGVAELSHDGRRVVTGSADQTARLWDASDGRQLAVLADHVSPVTSVHFSDDDAQVLTGGDDGFVKLWDAHSFALLRTVRAAGRVVEAVFAPDGGVAVSTLAGTLELWDRAGRARDCVVSPTQRRAFVSPDGRHAMVQDESGALLVALPGCTPLARSAHASWAQGFFGVFAPGEPLRFAFASGAQPVLVDLDGKDLRVRELFGHAGTVLSLAFSPDGNVLVTTSVDSTARAWDAQTGALIATFRGHTAQVAGADVSRDGRLLVTAGGDNTARIWDLRSGAQLATLEGHRNLVASARFSGDARRVLTVSRDGSARIWDVAAASALRSLPSHAAKLRVAAYSPDSRSALTAGDDGRVLLHALAGSAPPRVLLSGKSPVRFAGFSDDGAGAFAVAADGTARVWYLATDAPPLLLHASASLGAGALSPDRRLLAAGGAGGVATLFPLDGGAPRMLAGLTDEVTSLAFSPDGALVAGASADGTARLWRAATGEAVSVLRGHTDAVRSVRFSPDGKRLLTASSDGTARIWALGGAGASQTLRHRGTVYTAVFAPGGQQVLTASADATIRLWDAESGQLLRSIDSGGVPLTAASLSPSGELVVSSSDRETALWDLATSARLGAVPMLHGSEGNSASFSPDGQSVLVLAHDDGRALLWDVSGERRGAGELSSLVAARVPWRLSNGALVPLPDRAPSPLPSPARPQPVCAREACFASGLDAELGRGRPVSDRDAVDLYAAACAQGDARGCARRLGLQPEQLLDVLADGPTTWALYAVPVSSVLVNAYYGVAARGAVVHLARFESGAAREVPLNPEPLPLTGHGALGRDGDDVLAFFNLKRRSETYLCDGLLFRARLPAAGPPVVARTQLFAEWNAGFHPFFEGAALHHYSYDDRRLALDRDLLGPAGFAEARDQQLRHQLAALQPRDQLAASQLAREPGAVWSEYLMPRAQAAFLIQRAGAGAP
jgi:WD40 repeat protein